MGKEIERKFLVMSQQFKEQAVKATRIRQGYLSSEPKRVVRVRVTSDKGFITIKGATSDSGLSRYEWEKEIPVEEARELMLLCESGVIDKTRYLVPVGECTFEVDVFHGDNEGLTVAELELPAEETPFPRPVWLGREVTGDTRYYNAMLRIHPFKSWR